jgi:hypothetical protein
MGSSFWLLISQNFIKFPSRVVKGFPVGIIHKLSQLGILGITISKLQNTECHNVGCQEPAFFVKMVKKNGSYNTYIMGDLCSTTTYPAFLGDSKCLAV